MNIFKRIFKPWIIVRLEFPYGDGTKYGTYNRYRKMLLDTGLTRDHAIEICKGMNR